MGWRLDTIIEEYTAYAIPKTRDSDIKYIRGFEVQTLSQVFREPVRDVTSKITFPSAVSRARMVKMVAMAILMLSLWAFATVLLHP
jgi:tyrosine-protein phosphatase SIW14